MAPGADEIFIWLAMIDTGRSTGIEVSADITLSPTPLRANVGLIGLFEDRMNHLTCKLEVSEGHPDGLLTIGEQRNGETTSLLAERDGVGLRNGKTYHLTLTIPRSAADRAVRCGVSGGGIDPAAVSLQLTAASLAAYGDGTGQGLRIKIFDDEDDGRSSWDNFLVRPL